LGHSEEPARRGGRSDEESLFFSALPTEDDVQDLTPPQTAALERLVASGFHLVAFPLYASAIGVRRDSFAALLVPVENTGLRLLGPPCYLMDGNLSVLVQRAGSRHFVWKTKNVEATPDLLGQLSRFAKDLQKLLSEASP
jgi:hypothetical protein